MGTARTQPRAKEAQSPQGPRAPRFRWRALPSLGMRGGLGKTLLLAFLLLTIVPLSLLAFLTYNQGQHDARQKLMASLETEVALKGAHLADWVEGYERELRLLADVLDGESGAGLDARLAAVQASDPALDALLLVDGGAGKLVAVAPASEADADWGFIWSEWSAGTASTRFAGACGEGERLVIAPALAGGDQPLVAICHGWTGSGGDWLLAGLLSWDTFKQLLTISDGGEAGQTDQHRLDEGVVTRLVTPEGLVISAGGLASLPPTGEDAAEAAGMLEVLAGKDGAGAYTDLDGVPVFGAYHWDPDLQIGIVAEQSQAQALMAGDNLTALVVGATLAVALITAAIAAVVTRRVTRPIVQLTETAAWMARGDLNQQVTVDRRDEIGILARAFNRMAAELRVLYESLEAKVAERTRQLEEANRHNSYYIMQLAISAEVARVVASIRDLETLLTTVVDMIVKAFELHGAAVYLTSEDGLAVGGAEWMVCRAGSNTIQPVPGVSHAGPAEPGPTLVGQVAADGMARVVRAGPEAGASAGQGAVEPRQGTVLEMRAALQPPVACELAIPLRVRDKVLGVLHLQSTRGDRFGESDLVVYRSLADQTSIAIENVRAYALERETVERLRELDRIQSQFLTNMSHALRTPLNSIIGFSRVMLKGLDGPLTDVQQADLTAIFESGHQLLGLINDMLELSQLDLGVAPFSRSEVNLAEIIEGVMATTEALARDKPIHLYSEVPEDLPRLHTDGQRVRQVILALLSNAVKFTEEGSIRLWVTAEDGQVTISVSDTGPGIAQVEWSRIFSDAAGGGTGEAQQMETPGFGLAISKRVVERLGGRIWMEGREGTAILPGDGVQAGTTVRFTLPIGREETGQHAMAQRAGTRPVEGAAAEESDSNTGGEDEHS